MKKLLVVALVALLPASYPALVLAQSSPAKKELVAKVLKLQQPAIEMMARNLAELPAMQITQQVGPALQARVAPEKRDAVAKEIQADIKKYLDEAVPLVRDRAVKLSPSTIGVLLEERFSEDELKQVIAYMESPLIRKFQQVGMDMQRALGEKLATEMRGQIEPKVKFLEQSVAKRLGLTPPAGAAPAKPAK